MKTVAEPEPAKAGVRESSMISLFSDWVQQGTENFFAAQRILLDLVMRQNSMAMNALRERLAAATPGPAALTEVAGEGFERFIAAQKILLDLAKRQNEIVMTGVKERVGASQPAAAMTDLLRRSVDTFIDLQEQFLDTAKKQTKGWVDSSKTGKPFAGKGFAELAGEGFESLVQTQNKFLDLIAEETTKATKEAKGAEKAPKPPELTELARHSVEAFVEAQKKLMETAGSQIESNLKSARRAFGALTPPAGTTLADLTREGVQSFVAAQKALLDVMVKPRPVPTKGSAKEHAHRAAHPAHAR